MNVLKTIEKIVRIKNEIGEIRAKLEHYERELDFAAGELIEFLKHKKIIEPKS
jgi:hypothetical protein